MGVVLYWVLVLIVVPVIGFIGAGGAGAIVGFIVGGKGCLWAGFASGSLIGTIIGVPLGILHLVFGWPFGEVDAVIFTGAGVLFGFNAARNRKKLTDGSD